MRNSPLMARIVNAALPEWGFVSSELMSTKYTPAALFGLLGLYFGFC